MPDEFLFISFSFFMSLHFFICSMVSDAASMHCNWDSSEISDLELDYFIIAVPQ